MSNSAGDQTGVQQPIPEQLKNADTPMESPASSEKGKGKAPAQEVMMDDEDDEEDDEEDEQAEPEVEEADGDNMEEIDTENIVGTRTRGKAIDFAKAAEGLDDEDDDDEDDEDFEDDEDKMEQ